MTTSRRQAKRPAARGARSKLPTRRKLVPMRVSEGFRAFVLDQLSAVRDFRAKSMFGGIGLYAGDTFFGMVASDRHCEIR
jgi:hypothetical protein